MTLERARVIKGTFADAEITRPAPIAHDAALHGRRIPREVVDAREEAARIVEDAKKKADEILATVREEAAREAREAETARLAAAFLALEREAERRAERDLDRTVELATILAERIVGEGLRVDPARIADMAANALAEARGARRVRIDACPEDVDALRHALAAVGHEAEVNADRELARGSLVVHTELGSIDARLRPQLARLAAALREAMR